MGRFFVKPVSDDDFYIVYDTVIDFIVWCGTRDELTPESREPTALEELVFDYSRSISEHARRLWRADEFGTSAPNLYKFEIPYIELAASYIDDAPEEAVWFQIPRENVRAFCEHECSRGTGYGTWFDARMEVLPEEAE